MNSQGQSGVRRFIAMAVVVTAAVVSPGALHADGQVVEVTSAVAVTEPALRLATVPFVVSKNAIASAEIGQPSDIVIPLIERRLGPAESIVRRHLDNLVVQSCFGGTELIVAEWPGLSLTFVGDEETDPTIESWFSFSVFDTAGRERFQTTNGARVGDTVERWLALHPDGDFFEGEPDLTDPSIYLPDGLIAVVDPETNTVRTLQTVSQLFCE